MAGRCVRRGGSPQIHPDRPSSRAVRRLVPVLCLLLASAFLVPVASADGPEDRGKGKGDRDKEREQATAEERRDEEDEDGDERDEREARRAAGEGKDGCPAVTLEALALEGETVLVTAPGLDREAVLVRASGPEGAFDEVAILEAGASFHQDQDVSEGTVYTYRLEVGGKTCAQVEVTAIPVFPTPRGVGLAVAAGAIGLALTGRGPLQRR